MNVYALPEFGEPRPLGDGRTWTAEFKSFDQRTDDAYYTIHIAQGGKSTTTLIGQVPVLCDPQDEAQLRTCIEPSLRQIAAAGASNTSYTDSIAATASALLKKASDEALEVAARAAVVAWSKAIDLYYGDVTLLVRNFALPRSDAVKLVPNLSPGSEEMDSGIAASLAALDALAPAVDESGLPALAGAMVRASPNGPLFGEMRFEVVSLEDALARFNANLAASHLASPLPEARALLTLFSESGHRLYNLGDLRRRQTRTTAIFISAPTFERAALIEFLGDGP